MADSALLNLSKKYFEESLAEQRALRAEQQRTNQLLEALLQAMAPQPQQPAYAHAAPPQQQYQGGQYQGQQQRYR